MILNFGFNCLFVEIFPTSEIPSFIAEHFD